MRGDTPVFNKGAKPAKCFSVNGFLSLLEITERGCTLCLEYDGMNRNSRQGTSVWSQKQKGRM